MRFICFFPREGLEAIPVGGAGVWGVHTLDPVGLDIFDIQPVVRENVLLS